jgi:hypothetical protein
MPSPLVIATGQVATSATALVSSLVASSSGQSAVNAYFYNHSAASQTLTLTYQFGSNSAISIFSCTLAQNQKLWLTGIPLGSNDVLLGATTTASQVDYLIQSATVNSLPIQAFLYDVDGGLISSQTISNNVSGALAVTGSATAKEFVTSPSPTDTYAATMTIDVTYGFHVISASETTSAAVTMTPSAAGSEGAELTIVTIADASGTVTATFASTFHSSGTQATTASHNSSVTFVSTGTIWVEKCRTTAVA